MAGNHPIVIDNGTGFIKAGFAGDDAPKTVFHCTVGRPPKYLKLKKEAYFGDEFLTANCILAMTYPIVCGMVSNWNDMVKIWDHIFIHKLKAEQTEHPVLITDAPFVPKAQREKMTEIMFEYFKVPAMYVATQAVLALLASGRTTGIVVDCGDGASHAVPIRDGYPLRYAIEKIKIGGRDLTDYLIHILKEDGYYFPTFKDMEIVRDIKEKLGFVSFDHDQDLETANKKVYKLPDGEMITIGSQRFRCAEVLFEPGLMGKREDGIHQVTHKSLMNCDTSIRRHLYSNIVLNGGSTMFPGMKDRITKEISSLATDGMNIEVDAPPERQSRVWLGGSIVASLDLFEHMWISSDEYNEWGPAIGHRKCH